MSTEATVLFLDYGGVLADHYQDPAESHLASALHVDRVTLRALLSERSDHGRAFREDRITETAFWSVVATLAGCARDLCPSDEYLSEKWAQTYVVSNQARQFLVSARRRVRIGIATNVDRARFRYMVDCLGVPGMVDFLCPSFRYGASKPSREYFIGATRDVTSVISCARILYVDDREEHVRAASTAGWESILFGDFESLADQLVTMGVSL